MKAIKFNSDMVRAVLDGAMNQTRRPIKGGFLGVRWNSIVLNGYAGWTDNHGRPVKCPFGKVGDRLWVQETWVESCIYDEDRNLTNKKEILYRADKTEFTWLDEDGYESEKGVSWRSSSQMTQEQSRITLEITDIRVERIREMREGDVIAEGIKAPPMIRTLEESDKLWSDFKAQWDSIYKAKGFGWDTNCFVWVIEFKALTTKEG